jgi:peptide/nickel transport system permease protein
MATVHHALSYRGATSHRPRFWRRATLNKLAVLSAALLVVIAGSALCAPLASRYDPEAIDLTHRLQGPSPTHWLGTDETGRDYLTRLIYGGRVSLTVGIVSMLIAVSAGTLAGLLAGYSGRWLDAVVMRVADGMLSIPLFFFVLITLAVFGPAIPNIVLVIGLTSWMPVARIVRGDVLRTAGLEFVTAARAVGARTSRLLIRHVLPQALPSLIVASTLGVAQAILLESALSYLGLGVQSPQASWGNMLSNAQGLVFSTPQLAVYPGLMILITVLAFNSIGDALRDALDPT